MTHLSNLVNVLNSEIQKGVSSFRYCITGIVRNIEQNKQSINYDSKQNVIVFDNTNDFNIYHRKIDSSASVLQEKGKTKLYSIVTKMELVCYSKIENAQDYLINVISNARDFEITGIDDDSVKIFKNEVGQDAFDPAHFIFKIFYNIKYQSSNCETCLSICNDTKV